MGVLRGLQGFELCKCALVQYVHAGVAQLEFCEHLALRAFEDGFKYALNVLKPLSRAVPLYIGLPFFFGSKFAVKLRVGASR